MTGLAEASAILGLVSAIVGILDCVHKTYNAAHDAKGLPEAFKEVADRLPLVNDTLKLIDKHLQGNYTSLDDEAASAIQERLEICHEKARKLEVIFNNCIPDDHTSRIDRYVKAVQTVGKGNKVELLMKGLLEGVQDIVNHIGIHTAEDVQKQTELLTEAIKTMSDMKPSVEDKLIEPAADTARYVHSGLGDQYNASGSATQQIAKGNSRQFIGHNQHFGKE